MGLNPISKLASTKTALQAVVANVRSLHNPLTGSAAIGLAVGAANPKSKDGERFELTAIKAGVTP